MADNTLTDAEIAELAALDFDAILTPEQVQKMEENGTVWGISRRIAFTSLMRSKSFILRNYGKEDFCLAADTMMEAAEQVQAWKRHLEHSLEIADAAHARLLIVASDLVASKMV